MILAFKQPNNHFMVATLFSQAKWNEKQIVQNKIKNSNRKSSLYSNSIQVRTFYFLASSKE